MAVPHPRQPIVTPRNPDITFHVIMNSDSPFSARFQTIRDRLKSLCHLYIEKAKLTLAERMTLLLSAGLILFACALLCIMGLAFLSGSLVMLLGKCMSDIAAWAIVGGIYILIAALIILLRKPLVINPVARFISRLILGDEDTDESGTDRSATENRFNQ